MNQLHDHLEADLQKFFGFSSFREGQREIIESVLNQSHTLATLPTGSGKSICYQLPSKLMDGITIVVSPLISLMIDQVKLLKSQGFKRITALNSLLNYQQKSQILNHLSEYQLIYCSPEMLQQPRVIERLKQVNVSLFVIDEAHCISQWGYEFRPDYLRLKDVIQLIGEPTVLALSATATPQIQDDIIEFLDLDMNKIIYPMDRVNITYNVIKSDNVVEKHEHLLSVIERVKAPTMIYFSSRQVTEQICAQLQREFPDRSIAYYHGGMEQQDRLLIQQQFMLGQLDIICCTSAFGMGINKSDIRLIIHYHLPNNIESFIQETGRAGRDGEHSVSVLLYNKGDEAIPFHMIESELPDDKEIKRYINNEIDDELPEIKQRFLKFQKDLAEKESFTFHQSVEKIIKVRDQRRMVKSNSVFELLKWIHTEQCKRQALFESYQSNTRPAKFACCDVCDFKLKEWAIKQDITEKHSVNWKTILDELLPTK
ncbi:RecQ family ATP-dependent DNA helicase [Piscibacillus halophilus]|uniref:ATP-dependent DNA helicase RecQ n=2 Tax=Piscibacillus halophilus TaxID=571933 RepID=A0A1H8ZXT1_9BACI|nr:ATP-dependent DNA helicase RecQ [Piscibacillus halophilus]SEP69135.1 ATP-dependent DNA helicase RecQ [Piscibacillus halophilus]